MLAPAPASRALRLALPFALATLALAAPARAHGPPRAHIAELTREIAGHPDDAGLLLERADFLRIDRDFAGALADLARAESLAPGLARVDVCRARVWLDAGDPAAALLPLDRHLARCPADGAAWALRAAAHSALGRTAEAVADLDRAIAASPAPDPDLYLDRARALLSLSKREAALAGLRDGLARLGPVPALESLARELGGGSGVPASTREPAEAAPDTPAPEPGSDPPASLAATIVTRGPYLQRSTRHEITVRWRTSPATSSRVRWGSAPGALAAASDDPAVTTEHVMRLTGLEPGRRYWYSIGSLTETLAGDSTHYFWTNPESTSTGPTRVWVIGDSGLPGANQIAVRDAYFAWCGAARTNLWLMLGDNAYSTGTDAEYQAGLFDPYALALRHLVLWPTRGNHDLVHTGANNDYYDHFSLPSQAEAGGAVSGTEAYYSMDYANLHLVCLDSEGTSLSPAGAMRAWLRADLAANTRPWVIAFWHHPPYTKGSHDSDDPADSNGKMRDMRQNFLPLFDSLGVDLVLTGHSHSYERSMLLKGHYGTSGTLTATMKVDPGDGRIGGDGAYHKPDPGPGPFGGAVYAVAGSAAQVSGGTLDHPAMVASLNELGSMVLDLNGHRLDARCIGRTGAVLDSFTLVKGDVTAADPPAAGPALAALAPARPNPSTRSVTLGFTLPRPGPVRLSIHAADGTRVATLLAGPRAAGRHDAVWNGADTRGRPAPPGVYFAVLDFERERHARRLIRVR